jgi:hypothetical protein
MYIDIDVFISDVNQGMNSEGEEDEEEDEVVDERGWAERENSRTHSVKFTDAPEQSENREVSNYIVQ